MEKVLTPQQKELSLTILMAKKLQLSVEQGMAVLDFPEGIRNKCLIACAEKSNPAPEFIKAVLQQHQKFDQSTLTCFIEKAVQNSSCMDFESEYFNMPSALRDALLDVHVKYCGHCDTAEMAILELSEAEILRFLLPVVKKHHWLRGNTLLQITTLRPQIADAIFSAYTYLPPKAVFAKVVAEWTDPLRKKQFFLDNVTKISDLAPDDRELEGILSSAFNLPATDRDEVLTAYIKRMKMTVSDEIFSKVCQLSDPSRSNLLKLITWQYDQFTMFAELPELSQEQKTDTLIAQMKKNIDIPPLLILDICDYAEPNRTKLLTCFVEKGGSLLTNDGLVEKLIELPDPLRSDLVLKELSSTSSEIAVVTVFDMKDDALCSKALSAYFCRENADTGLFYMVFAWLSDETKKAVLLSVIKNSKSKYLFCDFEDNLFKLEEPIRTEVITAFVNNGWKFEKVPWKLFLLPEETRGPIIDAYAKRHRDFHPKEMKKQIEDLLGEAI